MKIKPLLLTIVFSATTFTANADPVGLLRDVVLAVGNNIGKPPFSALQQRQTIHSVYYENNRNGYCENRGNSFNRKVTYYDGYEYSKGSPPPQAFVSVRYPGPAPKYLYQDRSIQVRDHGDSHTIVYRKRGW
jgi:hypothetical protein